MRSAVAERICCMRSAHRIGTGSRATRSSGSLRRRSRSTRSSREVVGRPRGITSAVSRLERMMRALLLAGVVVGVACVSTPPTVHAEYQYALAPVPDPIAAGDTVQLTWRATPRDVPGTPPPEAVARVCVALIGPYADVAAAKASPGRPRGCPVNVPVTMAATVATDIDL